MIDRLYYQVRAQKKKDAFIAANGKVIQPEKQKPHHRLRSKPRAPQRPDFDTRINAGKEIDELKQ